jgi:hypothetical protein
MKNEREDKGEQLNQTKTSPARWEISCQEIFMQISKPKKYGGKKEKKRK